MRCRCLRKRSRKGGKVFSLQVASSAPSFVGAELQQRQLILLAFFALLFALVVLAHDFAVSIDLDAPLFPTFIDDGFIVRTLFFPANNFSAFSLRLGGFHHRRRYVRTADGFFFVFLFFCLFDNAEGESGTDRCDCEQLRCIHGYLISTDRSRELFENEASFSCRKMNDVLTSQSRDADREKQIARRLFA